MSNDEIEISVIVPTYERPFQLLRLLRRLNKSSFKKFEIIIVDQSALQMNIENFPRNLNIKYHHVSFRGAALARNFGAKIAKGLILAFTDDDCIPDTKWLENACLCFKNNNIVALEGRIYPEKYKTNPRRYRIVSNIGRENMAFMTANFFVYRSYFRQVDGFDERFNNPHFREDTDLGWRLQKLGKVIFLDTVKVLHPAELRSIGSNRNNFFVHDALLFSKHPEQYIELFLLEEHYIRTNGFWEFFLEGFRKHRVNYALLNKLLVANSINLGYVPLHEVLTLIKLKSNY